MENLELNIKANKFWNELSQDDKLKLVLEYRFWEGFSNYLYDYIPEDLKAVLRLKIEANDI